MKASIFARLICVCFMFATACSGQSETLSGSGLTVLERGTLIDGNASAPIPNSVVVLKGDRILRVGQVGDFRYPDDASIEDLSGRFLIPGLIDMHVHVPAGAERETLRMLLAFGITTIRSPGSLPEQGVDLRERVASGGLVGPRMFVAGRALTPVQEFPEDVAVSSVAEVQAEVRRQATSGVDYIKLYRALSPDLVRAGIAAAHEHGIKAIGHLGKTGWTEAALAGIDGLLHSGHNGPSWELVPLEVRDDVRVVAFADNGEPSVSYPEAYSLFVENVDVEGAAFDALVTALVENDVTVDPTLVLQETFYFGDDLSVLARQEPEIAPAAVLEAWGQGWQNENPVLGWDPVRELTTGKAILPVALDMIRRFHERGVRIVTGTDVGMPWINPGVSLHRELELLVDAGLEPRDVLMIAARNGAEELGVLSEIGTVEPGKVADLVVLGSNPIENIKNTRSIEAVFHAGQRYDPESLLAGIH